MSATEPVDHAERRRIESSELDRTLFVEAGAGTGKTHELVERIVHLVLDEGISLASIAAITFTEAAAAELRDRVRERFDKALASDLTDGQRSLAWQALDEVDGAAITTLHGFALRILGEEGLAIDLPPKVEVQDEVSSQLVFAERWRAFLDELYGDPSAESLVLRAWALGVDIEERRGARSLKVVAEVFDGSWDRLDPLVALPLEPLPEIDVAPLAPALRTVVELAGACTVEDDGLRLRMEEGIAGVRSVLALDDELDRLQGLKALQRGWAKVTRTGRKEAHPDVEAARTGHRELGDVVTAVVQRAVDDVLRRFAIRLGRFTVEAAEARRAEGTLVFHDLLVLARRLVRTSASARSALHERYQRLLLDEFQDTDPLQIEIAVLIAAAVAGGDAPGWEDAAPEPGRLFFVGDPKQSIYRFRRADIDLFLRAREVFGPPVVLEQSFRTVAPVLEWVNHVFGQLMDADVPGAEARYRPLAARRQPAPGCDHRVVVLGGPLEGSALELREAEAEAVASAVAAVRDDPASWQVGDPVTGWRDPTLADVTILVPTRTSLRQLEEALERHALPYRVATGTLVYDTQEVRDLLEALRAIDDPGDAVALVSALRSPLFACSDVDLFTFHQAGGAWDLQRPVPLSLPAEHPVVVAVTQLRTLHEERWWHEPSALLERLVRERRAHVLAFAHRRPREVWRRLRFLVDQARAFEEAGGGGLRAFLAWAELQRREGSRVHEPLHAEVDDVAVSILTIHGSKGLEFPITVLSGTTTAGGGTGRIGVVWTEGIPRIRMRADVKDEAFDRGADVEAEMDVYERQRLLYVACTRARDHLVVSGFHGTRRATTAPSFGRLLHECSADRQEELCREVAPAGTAPASEVAGTPVAPAVDDRPAWIAAREALLAARARPRFVSATTLAAGAGPVVDGEEGRAGDGADGASVERPWRRGRAGTAIGRAVHAVLQLHAGGADEPGLDALASQQAHLEAVPDAAADIAALARSALRSPTVVAAHAAERSWRELFVAAPLGPRAVEGYVDLLYEDEAGLVLVDYKTDAATTKADVDAKVATYSVQLATYAVAIEAATGLTVAAARLVFCRPGAAVEREVPDLRARMDEVRALVAAS